MEQDTRPQAGTPGAKSPGHAFPPAIELLRIGAGIIWTFNLVFIVDPANRFWAGFSQTALSFAPSTLGGPGLAQYVASHGLAFSWLVALLTGYLAVALTLGITTRLACVVGSCFSGVLLATQFGTTFFFPGGTDVGAHPLYILVYLVLALGGAGTAVSLDHTLLIWRSRIKRATGSPRSLLPRGTVDALPPRTLAVYAVTGLLVSFGVGFGLVATLPSESTGATPAIGATHSVNLTISINNTTGWPQYVPANFSVPSGRAEITISDNDMPMSWSGCQCQVRGTVGGEELVNGSPKTVIPSQNVAHTFSIPELNLEVLSPGQSVVEFTIDLLAPGSYTWYCMAPCGAGSNPYGTAPMGTPGYMTGTMTVAG